jgi:hypothetical protein
MHAPDRVLTINFDGSVYASVYTGNQYQSLLFVEDSGGAWTIKNTYSGLILSTDGCTLWAQRDINPPYQRFGLELLSDGSYIISSRHFNKILTLVYDAFELIPFHPQNRNQSFLKLIQGDGSWGVRKAHRSLFRGTVDPFESIKRVGNWFFNSNRQPTALHAWKGGEFDVKAQLVEGGSFQVTLWVGAQYADPDTAYATPRSYVLTEGNNTITDPGGGMVYVVVEGEDNIVNLMVTGQVRAAAHFEHHVTDASAYRRMVSDSDPHCAVELISDRTTVTVTSASALAYIDSDMTQVLNTHEQIIGKQEAMIGLDGSTPLHTRAPLHYHLVLGNHGGRGYAHASHGYTAYHMDFARALLVVDALKDDWGIAHELAHQNQMLAYKPADFTEVSNNIVALATRRMFNRPSTLLEKDDSGRDTWDRALAKREQPDFRFEQLDGSDLLAVLEQLTLAFGEAFWPRMNKIVREQWASTGWEPDRETAFSHLAWFGSMAAGQDLTSYMAAWNMPLTDAFKQRIEQLGLEAPMPPLHTLREAAGTNTQAPVSFPNFCCGTEPATVFPPS